MDLKMLLQKLSSVVEPEGAVVTLTLDLAKSGILPPATRVFLKEEVQEELLSRVPPDRVRRIQDFVAHGLKPGTNGLFLAAGRTVWEAVELGVPLRNFVTVGRAPYLAPLLEAVARSPRAYVVRMEPESAVVEEVHLGATRPVAAVEGGEILGRRSASKKTGYPGRGGAERDLRQRRNGEVSHGLLRQAAAEIAHQDRDAEAVYFLGRKEFFKAFRGELPVQLQERCVQAAEIPRDLDRRAGERLEREILEFHEQRQRGLMAALGPRDVLEHLSLGKVGRIYVDAYDPIPGVLCPACRVRIPGPADHCGGCSGKVVPVSITQEVIAHVLAHPPLSVTFVPPHTGWLRDLGGMAATLSVRGARRKAVGAGR